MIKETKLQRAITEYVSATDYPKPIPRVGKLSDKELKRFNLFFTNVSDELGKDIYYIGREGREHTFTNERGYRQYLQFIRNAFVK